ncbi:MAG: exodeoxyribonuclease VII large subunit, partial [Streptococcus equinus]|nr:exodeoxyribonuclease VII large subunit [Streptococcus equinus]
IKHYQDKLQSLERLLLSNMTSQYDSKLARFEKAQDALLSLDTSRIIARGYAMVQKNEKVISSVSDVKVGDQLTIQLKDGQLEAEVKDAK